MFIIIITSDYFFLTGKISITDDSANVKRLRAYSPVPNINIV